MAAATAAEAATTAAGIAAVVEVAAATTAVAAVVATAAVTTATAKTITTIITARGTNSPGFAKAPLPQGSGFFAFATVTRSRTRLQKTLVRRRVREDDYGLMAESSPQSIDVTYVADLARLRLSPEEIATFQKQLGDVLGYVSQLTEVDVSHVSLLGEADLKNNLRADVLVPSLSVPEALANAPKQENNLFVVPRMIEQS